MNTPTPRIALNFGGGYVPGLHAVLTGVVLAASELGWDVVGIRDGFDGLLFSEHDADGGVVPRTRAMVEHFASASGSLLGTAARSDPFHVRTVHAEHQGEEVDRSDALLATLLANTTRRLAAAARQRQHSRERAVQIHLSRKELSHASHHR